MNRLLPARRRWYVLGAFWVVMLVLGIGGFMQQAHDTGTDRSILDTLYLTLQLITLNYGGDSDLNWRLEIARFIAPLVAASTVLQTMSVVFREEFARFRLRFLSGHTVVIGLGSTGTRIARALADEGHTVVGVDRDASAPGVAALRARDLTVLVSDGRDSDTIAAVRLTTARQVVVTCGSDATNVAIAQSVRSTTRSARRGALRCAVQLSDAELCALLRGGDLGTDASVRVDFFNIHERAARALLGSHPPFADDRPPHLIVQGLGQLGRSLVVTVAQRWAETAPGRRLRLTLVDRVASGRWEALRLQHPALADVCTVALLDLDLEAPAPGAVDRFEAMLADDPTWVAVLFDDEAVALSAALLTRQTLADQSVPVIVRTRADDGIGALLTLSDDTTLPGFHTFPFLDRACTPDVVSGGVREQLARAMHDEYLTRNAVGSFSKPWDELSDDDRESSRRAADDLIAAFDSISFAIVPLRRWGAPQITLASPAVEQLSEREHTRWMDERRADGWTHGPVRDDARKTNPLLVDWFELDSAAKDRQRTSTRELPVMLARAGFEPVPRHF